jgi:hypothetical protein
MMLKGFALTTLEAVRAELALDEDVATNNLLARYIHAASETFVSLAGRQVHYLPTVLERVAGYGRPRLMLSRTPVVSIQSIHFNGSLVPASAYFIEDAEAGFVSFEAGSWAWQPMVNSSVDLDPVPGTERLSYAVTYAGGWITPQQELESVGERTLPYDIESAVIDTVSVMFNQRGKDRTVVSESILSTSVTYSGHTVSQSMLEAVSAYRRLF